MSSVQVLTGPASGTSISRYVLPGPALRRPPRRVTGLEDQPTPVSYGSPDRVECPGPVGVSDEDLGDVAGPDGEIDIQRRSARCVAGDPADMLSAGLAAGDVE